MLKVFLVMGVVAMFIVLALSFVPKATRLGGVLSWLSFLRDSPKLKIGWAVLATLIFIIQVGFFKVEHKHRAHGKVSMGSNLEVGKILAADGTKGLQIKTYPPGWQHSFKYPFFLSIEDLPDLVVPAGQFAILTAKDGAINDKIIAPKWSEDTDPIRMVTDAKYFLENGGTRGIQQYKVMPGVYPYNHYLFHVKLHDMREVSSGNVLVYESKYGKAADFVQTTDDEILAVPLVPNRDFRGIVDKAHTAGLYAIHPYTEKAYAISGRLQTFIYDGGYTKKSMSIAIDPEKDKLITVASEEFIDVPSNAHGAAFKAKTKDNFTVYLPLRVLGQIEPSQAPRFIGTFGSVDKLENKLIEPITKNSMLDIITHYTAQECITKRKEIGLKLSEILRNKTSKAGFRTKSVQIGEVDIPPIVLLPAKIASASDKLSNAMKRKQKAVVEVINVRRKQAEADAQKVVVTAEMNKKAAFEKAEGIKTMADANKYKANKEADAAFYQKRKEADAEKYQKEQQALGIKKLNAQLGKDVVGQLMIQDKLNEKAADWGVPKELTIINGGGSEGTSPGMIQSTMLRQGLKNIANK